MGGGGVGGGVKSGGKKGGKNGVKSGGKKGGKNGVKSGGKKGGKNGVVEVSPMLTVLLSATIVPLVESVRNCTLNISLPSVVVSFLAVIVKLPLLLLIVTLPLIPAVKSSLLIVPLTPVIVQYSTVPLGTFAVVIVAVVEPPSLIEVGDTAIA